MALAAGVALAAAQSPPLPIQPVGQALRTANLKATMPVGRASAPANPL